MTIPETKPRILMGQQAHDFGVPIQGLNRAAPPRALNPLSCWSASELRIEDNRFTPFPGREQIGSTLGSPVQVISHLTKFTTLTDALVATTTGLYKWVSTDWVLVSQIYDTGTVAVTNGSPTVTGTTTAWLEPIAVGDTFQVDGDAETYTILAVVGDGTITLSTNYAGSTDTGLGYEITLLLHGDTDIPVTHTFGLNNWIYTNGVDPLMIYDGTDLTYLTGGDDYQAVDTLHKSQFVRYFNDHLVLLATTEDGTEVFQRVRWSDAGSLTAYTSDNFQDLVDTPGRIMGAEQIGNFLAIYKKDSIVYMQPTGVVTNPFYFTTETAGVGLLASNTLVKAGEAHIFLGDALGTGIGVFANLGTKIVSIGDTIQPLLRDYISRTNLHKCWAIWDYVTETFILCTPLGQTNPKNLFIYETKGRGIEEGSWLSTPIDETTGVMCGGLALDSNALAIEDLVGTIEEQDWLLGAAELAADYETGHLGTIDGKILSLVPEKTTDSLGATLICTLETKAFNGLDIETLHGTRIRCLGIELVIQGNDLDVYTSLDEGLSWTLQGELTLSDTMTRERVDIDVSGESIMFRFVGNYTLEQILIQLQPRGRR